MSNLAAHPCGTIPDCRCSCRRSRSSDTRLPCSTLAATPKSKLGVGLWSNKDFIGGVDQFSVRRERGVTKDLVEVWDVGGKRKFRGNDETKSSQTYPVSFGEAIAKLFIKHGDALQQDARSWHRHVSDKLDRSDVAVLLPTIVSQSQGGWQDAMLDDVFAYLERQHV